jgi:hypothetical protein
MEAGSSWLFWEVLFMGMSSWITVNAVFSELPAIAAAAPEGWALASQLGVAIQLSNVLVVLYLVVRACVPDPRGRAALETWTIGLALLCGIAATGTLAVHWGDLSLVDGKLRSATLLGLTLFSGAVDCLSTVTFWPFVARFAPVLTSALAIGEGMSGIIPAVLALIQQSDGPRNLHFSVGGYFWGIAALVLVSLLAFGQLLRHSPLATVTNRASSRESLLSDEGSPTAPGPHHAIEGGWCRRWVLRCWDHRWVIMATFSLSVVLNGTVNAVLPYAAAALDPHPEEGLVYAVSNTLGLFFDPVGALCSLFPRLRACGRRYQTALAVCWSLGTVWLIVAASVGPDAGWGQSVGGSVTMVLVYCAVRWSLGFHRATLFLQAQEDGASLDAAVAMQVGACLGSLVLAAVVNDTNWFHQQS